MFSRLRRICHVDEERKCWEDPLSHELTRDGDRDGASPTECTPQSGVLHDFIEIITPYIIWQ